MHALIEIYDHGAGSLASVLHRSLATNQMQEKLYAITKSLTARATCSHKLMHDCLRLPFLLANASSSSHSLCSPQRCDVEVGERVRLPMMHINECSEHKLEAWTCSPLERAKPLVSSATYGNSAFCFIRTLIWMRLAAFNTAPVICERSPRKRER